MVREDEGSAPDVAVGASVTQKGYETANRNYNTHCGISRNSRWHKHHKLKQLGVSSVTERCSSAHGQWCHHQPISFCSGGRPVSPW